MTASCIASLINLWVEAWFPVQSDNPKRSPKDALGCCCGVFFIGGQMIHLFDFSVNNGLSQSRVLRVQVGHAANWTLKYDKLIIMLLCAIIQVIKMKWIFKWLGLVTFCSQGIYPLLIMFDEAWRFHPLQKCRSIRCGVLVICNIMITESDSHFIFHLMKFKYEVIWLLGLSLKNLFVQGWQLV